MFRWLSFLYLYMLLHQWVHKQWPLIKFVSLLFLAFSMLIFRRPKSGPSDSLTLTSGHDSNLHGVYSLGRTSLPNSAIIYAGVNVWSKSEFAKGKCYSFIILQITNTKFAPIWKDLLFSLILMYMWLRSLFCVQLTFILYRRRIVVLSLEV